MNHQNTRDTDKKTRVYTRASMTKNRKTLITFKFLQFIPVCTIIYESRKPFDYSFSSASQFIWETERI